MAYGAFVVRRATFDHHGGKIREVSDFIVGKNLDVDLRSNRKT